MNIQLSQVATQHMHRWGVLGEAIDVVNLYADRITYLNDGTYVLSLSRWLAQELRRVLDSALINRCENLQLVVDAATSEVIALAKNATFMQGGRRPLRCKKPDPRWA